MKIQGQFYPEGGSQCLLAEVTFSQSGAMLLTVTEENISIQLSRDELQIKDKLGSIPREIMLSGQTFENRRGNMRSRTRQIQRAKAPGQAGVRAHPSFDPNPTLSNRSPGENARIYSCLVLVPVGHKPTTQHSRVLDLRAQRAM